MYLILRKYKKTLSLSLHIYIYIYMYVCMYVCNNHSEQLTAPTCMEGRNKLIYKIKVKSLHTQLRIYLIVIGNIINH